MRVTSSEVMGSLPADDNKEKEKGGDTGGVDENAAERGRGRQHRKTVLIRHEVSPPTYLIPLIISLRRPFSFEPPFEPVFTFSTCGTYTPILRVCDAIWQPLRLAVYKGGKWDMIWAGLCTLHVWHSFCDSC